MNHGTRGYKPCIGVANVGLNVLTRESRIRVKEVRSEAPSLNFRPISSTGIRVPRITGLPSITSGFTSMRSVRGIPNFQQEVSTIMDFDPRDYDSRDEARSSDRDLDSRDREFDPRDAFTRDQALYLTGLGSAVVLGGISLYLFTSGDDPGRYAEFHSLAEPARR